MMMNVLSSKQGMFSFLAAFFVSQSWIAWTLGNTKPKLMRLQLSCLGSNSTATERTFLHDWNDNDYANMQRHFLLDLWIHPLLYGAALASIALQKRASKQQQPYFHLVPYIVTGASCDIIENMLHFNALEATIQFHQHAATASTSIGFFLWLGSVFAMAKWTILGFVVYQLAMKFFFLEKHHPQASTQTKKQATKQA
mmetsp:Transcript_25655/g.39363  ORF Transcript_25655/g.39363 Transcript_25655/m.39363 type:complete len:197 (+) Transcript_25655:252-842(+)